MFLCSVLIPQFKFGFLINDANWGVELMISCFHLSWLIPHVLGFVWNTQIIAFRMKPDHVSAFSICSAIQVWVFQYFLFPHVFRRNLPESGNSNGFRWNQQESTGIHRNWINFLGLKWLLLYLLELWYNTLDILYTNRHFSSISLLSRDRVKIT